jgi:hypothetical protein
MVDNPITLRGVTVLIRNGEAELVHHATIVIAVDSVSIQLDGCGPGCACYPELPSTDPAVVQFFHDIDARLCATQWKAAP